MKILILTHATFPDKIGGSEIQTHDLATELANKHDVTVITRWQGGLKRSERRNQFLITRLGRGKKFPIPLFSFTLSFLNEVKKGEFDLIFAKAIKNGFIACLAKKIFKLPVGVMIEGVQEYRDTHLLNRFLVKFVANNGNVIVQTQSIQRDFHEKVGIMAKVIPNGIYLSPIKAHGDKIIYVGRLVKDRMGDKGIRYLIDVVKTLQFATLIIGDGPEMENLKSQADGCDFIRFEGEVFPEKIKEYLELGLALVLPSLFGEGLPGVILEAMSVGLPIIASRTAGIPDVIQHGRTGFLIEPGNAGEMQTYIKLLERDRSLWQRMSGNCKDEAQAYAWENVIKLYEAFFLNITGS